MPVRSSPRQDQVDQQIPPVRRLAVAHMLDRQELYVSMRLTCAAVFARVEKRKQSLLLAGFCCALAPGFQAGVCRLQIILFQNVCLLLVCFCCEDEVFRDYGKLVQHEEVCWCGGGYVYDV